LLAFSLLLARRCCIAQYVHGGGRSVVVIDKNSFDPVECKPAYSIAGARVMNPTTQGRHYLFGFRGKQSSHRRHTRTMMRTFLRDLPREIRKRSYPFAIRVIHSKAELIAAVDQYMVRGGNNNRTDDFYPIGQWDVSNVQDFSYVFDANRNPLLIDFNEDLSNWDMSSATNLSHMFHRCPVSTAMSPVGMYQMPPISVACLLAAAPSIRMLPIGMYRMPRI
jgi:Mycoplasma protein of unknown function, DUF285